MSRTLCVLSSCANFIVLRVVSSVASTRAFELRRASVLPSISTIGDGRPCPLSAIYIRCGRPPDSARKPGIALAARESASYATRPAIRPPARFPPSRPRRYVPKSAKYRHGRRLPSELIDVSEQPSEARLQLAGPAAAGPAS